MLAPHELELLTAHVDGELSVTQRRQVAGLLERSGEAREMLQWLEEDARRLRQASRLSVPVDLSAGVLEEIGKLANRPVIRPKPAQPPRVLKFPSWRGVAAAAGVLLAIGLGSFLLHSRNDRPKDGGGLAGKTGHEGSSSRPDPDHTTVAKTENNKGSADKAADKAGNNDGRDKDKPPIDKTPPKVVTPVPPSDILAKGGNESQPKLERVALDLPTVARLHELDKVEAAKALTDRLAKLKTARIELTAKDGVRGFEHLRGAMQARKVFLHIDPATQARLKKTLWKTDVIVFLENIKAADVVELLRETGIADRQGEPRFDGAVVVKELTRFDRTQLTELLGLDPTITKPSPREKTRLDIHRELPEQTAREVVAALDGQGVPRPGAEATHHAYVSHLPSPKSRPPELKRFLELRQPPKAGTLQVLLLVLRHVGG